jgi:bifunctional non-homologous end joining protein LigD
MECSRVSQLPTGDQWLYEIKLDGHRTIVVKANKRVALFSRRRNSLNAKFPDIAKALDHLPDGTVIDGELVALDEDGRPNFSRMQNYRRYAASIHFFAFDIVCLQNRDLSRLPLSERKKLLESVLDISQPHVRISEFVETSADKLLAAIKKHRLEGIVGKRKDSVYEAGKRSGAWIKYRVDQGQEFVVGGYMPAQQGFDSIVVGYYKGEQLHYVARIRNGFVPQTRAQVFKKLAPLTFDRCPFVNLPETHRARWGETFTAKMMQECVWVKPKLVVQIAFLEWTGADRLRHSRFVGIREDKAPHEVAKET